MKFYRFFALLILLMFAATAIAQSKLTITGRVSSADSNENTENNKTKAED